MLVAKHLSLLKFFKPQLKMPAGDIRKEGADGGYHINSTQIII
jgi:hypothetical protein